MDWKVLIGCALYVYCFVDIPENMRIRQLAGEPKFVDLSEGMFSYLKYVMMGTNTLVLYFILTYFLGVV